MKPYDHQVEIANSAIFIIKKYGFVYLAMSPRTGKSLTSILICEQSQKKNILILTKKNAIDGFNYVINEYKPKKNYSIKNYEQASKLKSSDYDIVIIDEAHNFSTFPKPSERWKQLSQLTKGKIVIFLSGTPATETNAQLFHQLQLSSNSPFKEYKNFYSWHRDFGNEKSIRLGNNIIKQYDSVIDYKILSITDKFFIKYSQSDLGIKEASIVKHTVELSETTKNIYNTILKDKIITLDGKEIICDSTMKLRTTLHQIEGGTHKGIGILGNTEKIDYIKNNFNINDVAIMSHFISEREYLSKIFPNVYSSISHSEGVDLSHHKALIIYSQDYSGAKFSQRIDRLTNISKGGAVGEIHILTVDGAISDMVFDAVSQKKDFNDLFFNMFKKEI